MISPRVRAIYFKELRDALRDRRTIFATVVVPILLYPIMLLGMSEVMQQARARIDKEIYTVAVPSGTLEFMRRLSEEAKNIPTKSETSKTSMPQEAPLKTESIETKLPKEPSLEFREMELEAADAALKSGEIRAIVQMPEKIEADVALSKKVKIELRYDQAEHRSQETLFRLQEMFKLYESTVVKQRLKTANLPTEFIKPLTVSPKNVAEAVKVSGSIVGSFLPLLFIMMIIAGAMNPAIDMTAGEKERFTLETLIGMPVRPLEVISGKFLAVATLALGNAALNVASFGTTFSMIPMPHGGGAFQFPWQALPATLLLLAPLTLLFAGLLLAVSSLAANTKEAQIYCLPIYLVPVLGLMVGTMPGIELEGPLLLAPVLNTALLIKELFLGRGTTMQMAYVFCSTCMYAAGAVTLAARFFAREEVLFSSQGSFRIFLQRKFFKPAAFPRAGDSLLLIALLFPLFFYFQTGIVRLFLDLEQGIRPLELVLMMALPQYLLFLGLPLLLTWYLKLNPSTTFQWRMPPLQAVLGAVCLGVGAWPCVLQLVCWQSLVWPIASDDSMQKMLTPLMESSGGIALLVFLIAVTPAICEEHLFRGFLQQGLKKSGKWTALIVVGIIFGVYHLPLYRQPVVMLMGVVLAFVAFESYSIWPGVIFHCLFNALQVVGPDLMPMESKPLPGQSLPGISWQYLVPAFVLFWIGILLVRKSGKTTYVEKVDTVQVS